MKSILISIKPKECANILNLIQSILVSKTKPKRDLPIIVYIYCTKNETQTSLGCVIPVDLVDYRNTACYGDFHFITKGHKLTSDDKQPRLNGKVVAKFTLNKVEEIEYEHCLYGHSRNTKSLNERELCVKSCLTPYDFDDYLSGFCFGYVWFIDNLVIFDKPMELSDFYGMPKKVNTTYGKELVNTSLTKAPRSWCYVEV